MPRRKSFSKDKRPAVKHSGTFIENAGGASTPGNFVILETSGGERSDTGAPQTIQSFSSTDSDCKTGDTCKQVNLTLQCSPRVNQTELDTTVWLEWALICVRANETEVPTTRTGVQTLGDICTNMYRGECIYSGAIPIGTKQPAVAVIVLKIPKHKKKIKLGDQWRFLTYFRDTVATSTSTNAVRVVKSYNYKIRS